MSRCQVITLARFKLARDSTIPSDIGNTCLLQSFSSNSTFIMLYLVHEMDIDYLVVDEMTNISKLFYHTCMFRIGCKHIMITTQTWLKLVKKCLKLTIIGLCVHYHLKPLHA
jgi:hypothetical protein